MRLGLIFVTTLAISVILSSTATWGLTFSTSYSELRDMSDGFVKLTTLAVDDFAQLVWQLITDSGTLISSILESEYQRSMAQMNETQLQFLRTTIDLMARAKNATGQAQNLVAAVLVTFGGFIQNVIESFKEVGTDYASRLRIESASRTQTSFNNMMQNRLYSLQRQARLYKWGMLNLTRPRELPQDDGSCTLLGLMCSFSAEVNSNVFIGTASGGFAFCDVTDIAYSAQVFRGDTADQALLPLYPPFMDTDPNANYSAWKASCMAGFTSAMSNASCPHGVGMEYPNYCNGTCGYDPRCRAWYKIHFGKTVPVMQMSAVFIDIYRKIPVVALSYPIYAGSPLQLVAVAATDFYFEEVDSFLNAIGRSESSAQLVGVVLNNSDFTLVGASRPCPNGKSPGGVPISQACIPLLQGISGWLALNRFVQSNSSLELNGTLWDVFPSVVGTFTYFVAVGMNKTEVYAVVDATNQAANRTLQTLQQQQTARMAASEAAALAEMDAVAAEKVAGIKAQQVVLQQAAIAVHDETARQFNASRQKSAASLDRLIQGEMSAIATLRDYHLSQVVNSVGVTFGAVVGIFVGILLGGSYGTWIVSRQIQGITETMEDVANMKVEARPVEELQVSQKSSISEVQRIEDALFVLVKRLAEYKSYMPAGLFQKQQEETPTDEPPLSPASPSALGSQGLLKPAASPRNRKRSSILSRSTQSRRASRRGTAVAPVAGSGARLLRRNVAVLVVNVARFQGEVAQRSATHLESTLNRIISAVHRIASKAQGNIDAILGDQVLVTFNAHFACSDAPVTASNVALEILGVLREDGALALHVQLGLATGPMYAGHLGYAQFKAMVAMGAPMKVASLLAHLSGFEEHAALVCPSMAERIKYHFAIQPADLISLPVLGEHVAAFSKSVKVFSLLAKSSTGRGSQEWLYEVGDKDSAGNWSATFGQAAKANTRQQAEEEVARYLADHPEDRLARRLLRRLPYWQPHVGLVFAERPDLPHDAGLGSPNTISLTIESIN